MKQFKIIALCLTVFIVLACPSKEVEHHYITFVDKSKNKVVYQFSLDKNLTIGKDIIFECNRGSSGLIHDDSLFILECPLERNGWETELNNLYHLQVLVMDKYLFSQYYREPCDTIRKYVPILHCYRLTLEDLQRLNWTVVYPPEE